MPQGLFERPTSYDTIFCAVVHSGDDWVAATLTRLSSGSRVAIVGGGPAGSFTALFLLHFARLDGLDLEVHAYERRSFADRGPKGCNRCAGILSSSLLRNLGEMGISIPRGVVQARIDNYCLHGPFGNICIANPDPSGPILSVFRGSGPLHSSLPVVAGLDAFLLGMCEKLGTRIVREKVLGIDTGPGVLLQSGRREYDLVVLAGGLNSGAIELQGLDYKPPRTLTMSQDELQARPEDVQRYLGSSVQSFVFPRSDIVFGTLVPKGSFVNVSLLGAHGPPDLEEFLDSELVKEAIPFPYQRSCGCRPRICAGMATGFYSDGFIAVGDAAVARLYKDGIGSALLTARQAAYAAVRHGISRRELGRHYAPACHAIDRDNRLGRILFGVHGRAKNSRPFFLAQGSLVKREQANGRGDRVLSRILWGIFTGSYSYRQIWGMAASVKFIAAMVLQYIAERRTREHVAG